MSSDYPSDWNSRRKRVYKRDDYTCKNCGIKGGPYGNAELHAHHVVPKSRGGTHDVSNLISLCNQCHKTVHSKNAQAPTAYQDHGRSIDYTDPDIGDLADIILEDTETIVSASGNLLVDTYSKLQNGSLDFEDTLEMENELRVAIISTFEMVEMVPTSSTTGYSVDFLKTMISCIKEAEELLLVVMSTLDLIDECIFDLVDQATSCPKCGTSIGESDSFCTGCGVDFSKMIPSCPECDSEVLRENDFCGVCGTKLEAHVEEVLGTAEIHDEWHTRMERNLEKLDSALEEYIISERSLEAQFRVESEMLTNPIWEFCPSCGFPGGTLRSSSGIDCVVCGAEWEDRGILNRRVEMVSGPDRGASMPESEWGPIGERYNQEERFREVIFPDSHFA